MQNIIENDRTTRTYSIYRLTAPMKNPVRDKRKSGIQAAEYIPTGAILYVCHTVYKIDRDPPNVSVRVNNERFWNWQLEKALADFPQKELIQPTSMNDYLFLANDTTAESILASLLKHGKVTGQAILAVDPYEEIEIS